MDAWLYLTNNFGHSILTMLLFARPKPRPPYALFGVLLIQSSGIRGNGRHRNLQLAWRFNMVRNIQELQEIPVRGFGRPASSHYLLEWLRRLGAVNDVSSSHNPSPNKTSPEAWPCGRNLALENHYIAGLILVYGL